MHKFTKNVEIYAIFSKSFKEKGPIGCIVRDIKKRESQ